MVSRSMAGEIANDVIRRLREQHLDCVGKGNYYDVSGRIHDAVFYSVLDAIDRLNAPTASPEDQPSPTQPPTPA